MNTDSNKPIWQLTVREFVALLDETIDGKMNSEPVVDAEKKEYVYGIKGLANILGCSKPHAQRIKSSGILDDAIIQNGRKIIIDKEKALELFKTSQL